VVPWNPVQFWLCGFMRCNTATIHDNKHFERVWGVCKCHQCRIRVSFDELHEPSATLALSLDWMLQYYRTWTLTTLITQSPINKTHMGYCLTERCTNSAMGQGFWKGVRKLQFTSAHHLCFLFVVPWNPVLFWQCSITMLQELWLCSLSHPYIWCTGGIVLLKAATIQPWGKLFERVWGGCNSHQHSVCVCFVWFHETLFHFGFVSWLDVTLLQYVITSVLKECKGVEIVISAGLV
jgi:hypothetical protein